MPDDTFRKPVIIDDDGGYITNAQIKFYMNRYKGYDKIQALHGDFVTYTEYCKIYNYLWDCSKDSDKVIMFWDAENETIAFTFPKRGEIAETIFKWKFS